MSEKERIEELLHYFRMEQKEFAEKCGFTPEIISNIKREKQGISKRVFSKIIKTFLQVNKSWLSDGEGEMIKDEQKIDISGGSFTKTQIGRDHLNYNVIPPDEICRISFGYQDIIKKQQEQMDKLIEIISNK